MYVCMYVCTYILCLYLFMCVCCMYVLHVCILCMYIYNYICTCMCRYVYVHVYNHVCVYMTVLLYVHVYTHFRILVLHSTAFTSFCSTVSVFLLFFVHSEIYSVVILCMFKAITIPLWNVTTLLIVEIYPTSHRQVL